MAHFTRLEAATLERLRARFLLAKPGADYWQSEADLALYDELYAARIGWKWDAVLAELSARGWRPRSTEAIDWACGTGVASRRVLEHWPGALRSLTLYDRSALAMRLACDRAHTAQPTLEVRAASPGVSFAGRLVLLSHVLNELELAELKRLVQALGEAEEVIWVEAGTHQESRRLVEEVREPLLASGHFVPVAPCTHAAACGLRTPANGRHWCHSFGRAPSEVFQSGRWADFARILGIDLRTVPYSFLVLARAPAHEPGPAGASRVIGRLRDYKGFSKVLSCQAEGVTEFMLQKRDDPALLKALQREEAAAPVYRWERVGERIVGGDPAAAGGG